MQQDGLQIQILQVKCLETMKQIEQDGLNVCINNQRKQMTKEQF